MWHIIILEVQFRTESASIDSTNLFWRLSLLACKHCVPYKRCSHPLLYSSIQAHKRICLDGLLWVYPLVALNVNLI